MSLCSQGELEIVRSDNPKRRNTLWIIAGRDFLDKNVEKISGMSTGVTLCWLHISELKQWELLRKWVSVYATECRRYIHRQHSE